MLLTVTATRSEALPDASDLGYLLHKHPDCVQHVDVFGGRATVLYPETSPERCTAALLLEVDPIALVKGRQRNQGFALAQYVNDRPYAATSLLSVALGKVFRTALNGQCRSHPDLVEQALDLEIHVPALPGGADTIRALLEPLDWTVEATPVVLDPDVPAWGDSTYCDVRLTGTHRLATALNHLYVLIPVLDDGKHYWVGPDEVEKLVRAGTGWLAEHPARELISRRYLARQRDMVDEVLTRLSDDDEVGVETEEAPARPLVALRHEAVIEQLERIAPSTVLDLGCGQGALLRQLMALRGVTRVVGTEVSSAALDVASRRLHVASMTERQADRLDLWLSSLPYQDPRLVGFDAAVLMEVVEHVDPERLPAVTANVFGFMRPGAVVLTTPNREFNATYDHLLDNGLRHPDHRFEWTRAELADWADEVGERYGYRVELDGIGPVDERLGSPTQLAVFRRVDGEETA